MDRHKDVKKRFLPLLERYEPIFPDSSSLATYKKCPRLYFYQYVLAKAQAGKNWPIIFGSAYHKFREVLSNTYFAHVENGGTIDNFPDSDLLKAIKEAWAVYDKEGGNVEPNEEDDGKYAFLTKSRLTLSCKYAYSHWVREIKQGQIKVIGVELPGNFTYSNGERKTFRVDELIIWNRDYYVRDFKASSQVPAWYGQNLFFKDQAYTYITGITKTSQKPVKGIIYEQLYNDKDAGKKGEKRLVGPEIHTHIITFTPSQLENWEYEQKFWHDALRYSREHDIYPMAEDEYKCAYCSYKKLCTSNNQNQIYARLNEGYKTHLWDNSNI